MKTLFSQDLMVVIMPWSQKCFRKISNGYNNEMGTPEPNIDLRGHTAQRMWIIMKPWIKTW